MSTKPTHTAVPESACTCGAVIVGATGTGRPKPGDLSICVHCGALAQYGADLVLAPVAIDDVPPEHRPQVRAHQAAVRAFHASRPN